MPPRTLFFPFGVQRKHYTNERAKRASLLKEKWKIKIKKKEELTFYQKDVDDGISNEIRGGVYRDVKFRDFFLHRKTQFHNILEYFSTNIRKFWSYLGRGVFIVLVPQKLRFGP